MSKGKKQASPTLEGMEWVIVEIQTILGNTAKAGLFKIKGEEVWIPFSQMKFNGSEKTIVIRRWIAEEKGLSWLPEYHRPEHIEPIPNQEPIDDLRYEPTNSTQEAD